MINIKNIENYQIKFKACIFGGSITNSGKKGIGLVWILHELPLKWQNGETIFNYKFTDLFVNTRLIILRLLGLANMNESGIEQHHKYESNNLVAPKSTDKLIHFTFPALVLSL